MAPGPRGRRQTIQEPAEARCRLAAAEQALEDAYAARKHEEEAFDAAADKGLKVHFVYGGCGIRRVNVVDYIASSRQPGPSRLEPTAPTPSIALRFDGWMLPKAGVGFVWVLEREMAPVGAA
jgi:hypothetical protein